MSLVNSRTPGAVPEDQHQGDYAFIPPEVYALAAGENVGDEHSQGVLTEYFHPLPVPSPAECLQWMQSTGRAALAEVKPEHVPRPVVIPPAFAQPYGATHSPKRQLVKKGALKVPQSATVCQAVNLLIASLSDEDAFTILADLAARFDYDIR